MWRCNRLTGAVYCAPFQGQWKLVVNEVAVPKWEDTKPWEESSRAVENPYLESDSSKPQVPEWAQTTTADEFLDSTNRNKFGEISIKSKSTK